MVGCSTLAGMRGVSLQRTAHAALALPLVIACSSPSEDSTPSCPNDLPASCPDPAPSYASDVAPLMQARCFPCHDNGGTAGAKLLFTNYAQVFSHRQAILSQVHACRMPPAGASGLSASERATLQGWLVCHAPDN